jgi:hypothetical protein
VKLAEWREYKALNLGELHQGMAWFKDNEHLIEWANDLPLAPIVDCLGDGHDGVWGVYAQIGNGGQRHEILDWFHLMENLHQVSLPMKPNVRNGSQLSLARASKRRHQCV